MVGSSATTYTDRNLGTGKPYQYAVKAYGKQKSKFVYSRYTAVKGATRPYKTTVTPKVLSSSQVKLPGSLFQSWMATGFIEKHPGVSGN